MPFVGSLEIGAAGSPLLLTPILSCYKPHVENYLAEFKLLFLSGEVESSAALVLVCSLEQNLTNIYKLQCEKAPLSTLCNDGNKVSVSRRHFIERNLN